MHYEKETNAQRIPVGDLRATLMLLHTVPALGIDTEARYNALLRGAVIRYIKGNPINEPFLLTLSDGANRWVIDLTPDTIHIVKDFSESYKGLWVFFNATFDLHMLLNIGIDICNSPMVDVMIMHHLLEEWDTDADDKRVMGLKDLTVKYIDKTADKYDALIDTLQEEMAKERGVKKDDVSYHEMDLVCPDLMTDYAGADPYYNMLLWNLWKEKIHEDKLGRVLAEEMAVLPALLATERNGTLVDMPYVLQLQKDVSNTVFKVCADIYALVGHEFNLDSANELVEAFQQFGVEYTLLTEKGAYSTDEASLTYWCEHEDERVVKLATLMLAYRNENKLLNTFIQGIIDYVQPDGRVHTSFWQAGTVTGRMSSSNPNFQNYPRADDRIRRAFIPTPGYIFVFFDYAAQEYRLLAHYAQDEKLMSAIRKGWDIHKATAATMFNTPYDEVTKEQRNRGKTMNFAVVYGTGNAALAQSLGYKINKPLYDKANAVLRRLNIKPWKVPPLKVLLPQCTEEELPCVHYYFSEEARTAIAAAEKFKKEYFAKFPLIKEFIYNCRDVAKRRGYIFNWAGRRRRFKKPQEEAYKGPNALIQGGCGDIIKDRGAKVHHTILPGRKTRIVNWIHDEMKFEVHLSELHLIPQIKAVLEDLPFRVPITVDVEWSNTCWPEKKKFVSEEETLKEVAVA